MSNIRLKTEIPGPNSRALTARRLQAIPRGVYASTPLFVRHAEGAMLEDVDGNRFIDLGGGIGCVNVGHRNSRVVSAVRAQLDAFLHLCFQVTGYESYVAVAEKLNQLTPGSFAKKTFLVNSGAEAVENAVKIARAFTGRPAVLSVEDGFHGRTMLGLSLTSKTHPYKEGFGPFLPDVYRIPYGVPANARLSSRGPMTEGQVAELLDQTFRRVVAAESVAAIVVEPVLGEGGFVVPPAGFLPALAKICRERGIVFIADEVQTGFGRTGELFASSAISASSRILSSLLNLLGAACRWRRSPGARRSWMLLGRVVWAAHSAATPRVARRRWRSSRNLLMESCWRVGAGWESNFNAGLRAGNGSMPLSATFAGWGLCRRWSLLMLMELLARRRRKSWCSIACSMACWC